MMNKESEAIKALERLSEKFEFYKLSENNSLMKNIGIHGLKDIALIKQTLKELEELKKKVLNLADSVAYLGDKDMYNGVQFEISEELKRLCKGVDDQ